MAGAALAMMMAGGGKDPVNLSFITSAAAASGTYTVPTRRCMVVLCWSSQTNPVTAVSSVTISGHTATKIIEQIDGAQVDGCGIWAAMVDPGDANTWSVTQSNIFSGRCGASIFKSDATRINATDTFGSRTVFSHTANIGAGGSFLGSSGGLWTSGSPAATWTLLTEDSDFVVGLKNMTAAHKNYTGAATGETASVTLSGSSQGSLATAVLEP